MSMVEWGTDLCLGFEDIDDQHHKLVDLINEFDGAVRSDQPGEVLSSIMHDLLHYTIHHFSFEEDLMDRHRLKCGPAHKEEHRQLLTQMRGIRAVVDADAARAGELLDPLGTWLTEHLLQADATLVEELKAKAVRSLL